MSDGRIEKKENGAEAVTEDLVIALLREKGLTVTCAESCTGGMLSARLINVPGVSDIYKSGVITYANETKQRFLKVKKATLRKYGAVSEQTAKEMAKGAAKLARADVAVAITGIAGPDGGTVEKPVGLVYISCNIKGNITVKQYHLSGDRQAVREATVSAALMQLYSCILREF